MFDAFSIVSTAYRRSAKVGWLILSCLKDKHDVVGAIAAITNGVNDGSLTAEEAGHLVHLLEGFAKVITTYDLTARLEALESQMKK